jgi:hypothetical protein
MTKKLSYYEVTQGKPSELMNKYKMNERQFEMAVRDHTHGAKSSEIEKFYDNEVYSRVKRR